jgi:hypothetical protein
MKMRSVARLSALGVAVALLGCADNSYETTDLSTKVNITPLYAAVDEGEQLQYAVKIGDTPTTVTSWTSSNTALATVNSSGLVTTLDGPGGFAAITATLANGTQKSASLTINNLLGTALTSGVARTGIGGAAGTSTLYRIYVPAGKTQLRFNIAGGTGDPDIFVKYGTSTGIYDENYTCYPTLCPGEGPATAETVTIANPSKGSWYVLVYNFTTTAGWSLTATVSP